MVQRNQLDGLFAGGGLGWPIPGNSVLGVNVYEISSSAAAAAAASSSPVPGSTSPCGRRKMGEVCVCNLRGIRHDEP